MKSKTNTKPPWSAGWAASSRHCISSARRLLALSASLCFSLACATYQGTSVSVQPSVVARDGDWTMVRGFPLVLQEKGNDCGAAALAAVLSFWGVERDPRAIVASLGRDDKPLKAGDMTSYARSVGLRAYAFFGTMKDVEHELTRGRPVIVGLGKRISDDKALSHYEVVVGFEPNKKQLLLLDPGGGWQVDSVERFAEEWAISNGVTLVTFLPTLADAPPKDGTRRAPARALQQE